MLITKCSHNSIRSPAMTEKQASRPRGRPKKTATPAPQTAPAAKVESQPETQTRNNWRDLKAKYGTAAPDWSTKSEFASGDEDRLAVPAEVIASLRANGIVVEWKTQSVLGQEQAHTMNVH